MKRALGLISIVLVAAFVFEAVDHASAADPIKGRYRIILLNGSEIWGDVTQLPTGDYRVENVRGVNGITQVVKKNNVRDIKPMEEAKPAEGQKSVVPPAPRQAGRRRAILDTEIEEVLAGISAEIDESQRGVAYEDLRAPLPKDEARAREMHRLSGSTKEHVTDHFIMVYTGPDADARRLGSRLEAVWRWNVRFVEMVNIPAKRPDSKLEVFYFNKYEEIENYSAGQGNPMQMGVLGYFMPPWNRSHFFDMANWPPIQQRLDQLKDARGAAAVEARRRRNEIARWVEYQNIEVIQHEAGHHIHFNIGLFPMDGIQRDSGIPRWLVEGTTMLFEFPANRTGAGIGTINNSRLDQIRRAIPPGNRPGIDWWKDFMLSDRQWFQMGGGAYPFGWAMVNYLWTTKREGYAGYLRDVFGRPPDFRMDMTQYEAEFENRFGVLDEKWIEDFYKYLDSLQLNRTLLPPDIGLF